MMIIQQVLPAPRRFDSHQQWLTGGQEKKEAFAYVFTQCLSFIWQGYFLICSLFILRTSHLHTLYAAKVLITTQFFIYILFLIYNANEVAQSVR